MPDQRIIAILGWVRQSHQRVDTYVGLLSHVMSSKVIFEVLWAVVYLDDSPEIIFPL